MTYTKNVWVDQDVERPKTYEFSDNSDGSSTLIERFGNVVNLGTPVNAVNMNHIEDGIEANSIEIQNKADKDLANTNPAQSFINLSNGWMMIDWANKVSKTYETSYTANKDGWIWIYSYYEYDLKLTLNSTDYLIQSGNGTIQTRVGSVCIVPVAKNTTYLLKGATGTSPYILNYYFIPMKGAN